MRSSTNTFVMMDDRLSGSHIVLGFGNMNKHTSKCYKDSFGDSLVLWCNGNNFQDSCSLGILTVLNFMWS